MDFVFDVPMTKEEYTAIIVVVDKLSNLGHLILLKSIMEPSKRPNTLKRKYMDYMGYHESFHQTEIRGLWETSGRNS